MGFAAIEGDDDSTKGELSIAVSWNDEFKRVIAYWKQPRLNRTRTSGEHPRPREPVGQPVAWRARAGKRLSLRRLWKPVSDAPARCTSGCADVWRASRTPQMNGADLSASNLAGSRRSDRVDQIGVAAACVISDSSKPSHLPPARHPPRDNAAGNAKSYICTRNVSTPPSRRTPNTSGAVYILGKPQLQDSRPENSTRPVGSSPGTSSRLKAGRARRSVRTSARVS
ncbi:uncharacterized protein LOC119117041 isoform X7 [Syngnathus acus]|uniref:uncharacterized protein LOC119117041 isoform X7 n=1 Tax=Syngnathus acus TaxID=161584 RepID=UPI001885CC25|nr:uncharacterized protein LOC119117041 isoform X7 [Syngnathus acus]